MNAAALLIACLAALETGKSELVYTAGRGSDAVVHRIPFKGEHPDAIFRMVFDDIPSPVRNLPVWLPPESREIGAVVYDDGEGFKHDKGKEIYVLRSKEKWKGFDALGLSYGYQGMQQHDNWTLEARYDSATGLLLTATVRTRLGRGTHVTFEVTLTK